MKKTTKGALASAAAAAVLLGGAGSLAYWDATASQNGGAVTSGTLSLTAVSCDSVWTYANGGATGSPVGLIVPGDAITKNCTFTVGASGDHLTAALTAPPNVTFTKSKTTTTHSLNVVTTYSINRTPTAALVNGDTLTSSDNTKTLTAKFVVTMPFGSTAINSNDTQNLTTTLDALTVKLTQTQSGTTPNNPNP